MSSVKKGKGQASSKRSLEEESQQSNDDNTPKTVKKILESNMFASICLPKVCKLNVRPPTKKIRLLSPVFNETTPTETSNHNEHDDNDDALVALDDTILDFDDSTFATESTLTTAQTSMNAAANENTSKDANNTSNEELEEPQQPISAVAARRAKKANASASVKAPTKDTATPSEEKTVETPPISALAARRAKKAAEEATRSTSAKPPINSTITSSKKTTTVTPPISALPASRAKNATEAATTSTSTKPPTNNTAALSSKETTLKAPPISPWAAKRAKEAEKAEVATAVSDSSKAPADLMETTATVESPVSALAAARAKKAAATSKSIESSPSISAVAARQAKLREEPKATTDESSISIITASSSDRAPGKIFGSSPSPVSTTPSSQSSPEPYKDHMQQGVDEDSDEFMTPAEPDDDESQVPLASPKNKEKKKRSQMKESNKLMDPHSVSTYSSDNAIPFEHEGDTYYCIGFEKGQKLVFIGYSLIGALYGSIDICGATISSNHDIPTQLNSDLEPSQTVSFFPVFSPRTSALAVVQSIPYAKTDTVSPSASLTATYSDLNPLLESFLPRLDTLESIIIVKNMEWCGVDQLELVNPSLKNLFRLDSRKDFVLNDGSVYEDLIGFQPIVRVTPEVRAMKIEPAWSTSVDAVLEFEQDSSAPSVSIVCGTKNVGKSSFARYMLNRLLKSHQRVAYLETDVGQTEFTPSGLVSLHIVESPLLGPAFTHLHLKAKRSYFIGSASPKNDSAYYQDCIHQLLVTYRKEFDTIRSDNNDISQLVPLVVNTCGWIKGLGYDLLLELTKDVAPTHIFTFTGGAFGSGFGPSLPDFFEQQMVEAAKQSYYPEFRQVTVVPMQAPSVDTSADKQQQSIPASSPYHRQGRLVAPSTMADKYQPIDHRNLMLLSYMYHDAQVFGTRQNERGWWHVNPRLVNRVPWTIDWQQHLHGVWVLFEDVPPSKLLYALNGSLVGLIGKVNNGNDKSTGDADIGTGVDCTSSMEIEEEVDAQSASPKMEEDSQARSTAAIPLRYYSPMTSAPPNPLSSTCYGVGIIRGIDTKQRRFHLLTPLPLDQLRHVNSLVKGELDIPVHLMLDQYVGTRHQNCGIPWRQIPYLSHDVIDSVGSSAPKLRRNLMRRSQNIE